MKLSELHVGQSIWVEERPGCWRKREYLGIFGGHVGYRYPGKKAAMYTITSDHVSDTIPISTDTRQRLDVLGRAAGAFVAQKTGRR